MSMLAFGAKPHALRCARCGRFVDWAESQLQTVCSCRSRPTCPAVLVRQADPADRVETLALFRRDFGRAAVLAFGELMSLEDCPIIIAEMRGELAGALAYRLLPDALHIMALATDPMWQRSGVATHLAIEAEALARRHGVSRLVFATTNDNLPALYFYQRRGWTLTEVVPGAMIEHVKPHDRAGFAGIPVRDEIRMEKSI
ncbi:MAG TPA: GNAT family N-acetyltransferase [Vicinamibacterales bacterium]|jgi:ribosomal protein S18 acetylase RimI-like enzyme